MWHWKTVFWCCVRSHSLLKLDQKVSGADIWLSTRKEDVAEVLEVDTTLDGSRSFVFGWPTTANTVVTFCTSEEKALWVARIEEYSNQITLNLIILNMLTLNLIMLILITLNLIILNLIILNLIALNLIILNMITLILIILHLIHLNLYAFCLIKSCHFQSLLT